MKKSELVFIPATDTGHLVSTVEIAKLLVDRDDRLSITILIVKLPSDNKVITFTESLTAASNFPSRIKFIILPDDDQPAENQQPVKLFAFFIETQKPQVKKAVTKLTESPDTPQLAGFVLDMFCTCMIEIADEFKVPSYVFFTCSAAYLGFMFHVQSLHDEENFETIELNDSDYALEVPSFANSVPAKVWPTGLFSKEYIEIFYQQARKFRGAKGIMVNTFDELESYAVRSLSNDKTKTPPVYTVGPILNINRETFGPDGAQIDESDIMTWLDDQPESTVVFLCFGSVGSFDEDQVKEIACALEQSGHRFLWSLRRVRPTDKIKTAGTPIEYKDPKDVLPEGFFDRTAQSGKVIGWAPQVAILGHPAIGGFVSHCGWNSTLESIWFGVPLAAWPVYAEQQINAFELVMELGLAVEIKMDYKNDFTVENVKMVSAMEIERGIRCVMEHGNEVRKRIKEMSDGARKSLLDGGSSFSSVSRLIDDVLDNIA